jgi:hypothetical protein
VALVRQLLVFVTLGHSTVFNQDANICVQHLGLLGLLESTHLHHSLQASGLPKCVIFTLWIADCSTKRFKCDSLSPCHLERYIITQKPYNKSVRHHRYPSWVTCSTHVTLRLISECPIWVCLSAYSILGDSCVPTFPNTDINLKFN